MRLDSRGQEKMLYSPQTMLSGNRITLTKSFSTINSICFKKTIDGIPTKPRDAQCERLTSLLILDETHPESTDLLGRQIINPT